MIRTGMMAAILVGLVVTMRQISGNVADLFFPEDPIGTEVVHYWPESSLPVIHHSSFSLGYDEKHEQARWVAYVLTREQLDRKFVKRTEWFEKDESVLTGSADFYDYKGSGYTKGHLVPSADRAWSREVNQETFLMSNISPQEYHFNAGVWRELEENVRDWARDNDRLFIVTVSVFGQSTTTIGVQKVTVPEAFYKVILDLDQPEQKAIGFVIPNEKTDLPLSEFARSVDEVEEMTGIDFFDLLITDDDLEAQLEADFDIHLWEIDPRRYQRRVEVWNK